jgi:hypothetical protein
MASLPSGSQYLGYANGRYIYYLMIDWGGNFDTQIYSSGSRPGEAQLLVTVPCGGPVGWLNTPRSTGLFYVRLETGNRTGRTAVYATDGTVEGTNQLLTVRKWPGTSKRTYRWAGRSQKWLVKFGKIDKWNFCLRAARLPRIRSDDA